MQNLDIALMLIGLFLAVGGVIIAFLGFSYERRKLVLNAQIAADNARAQSGDTVAEIARLKDRVSVLEKLVTDDDRRLASEIARLRTGADARG
jgi:cell division protein FtsB